MKPKPIKKRSTLDWIIICIGIFILILCTSLFLCGKASGQNPTVNAPVIVDTTTSGDELLSIPRYKGLWGNGDTLYLFHTQAGASQPGWYYSTDAGASWTAVLGNFEDDGYLDMHSSFFLPNVSPANKGIFGTATDGIPYVKRIRLDATHHGFTTADTVARVNLTTQTQTWYTNVVATDTLNAWIFYRIYGSYGGIKYKHTTDGWATVDSGVVLPFNIITSNLRVGAVLNADTPYVVVLAQFAGGDARNGFYYSKWNGTAFDAPNDSCITKSTAYSTNNRAFSVAMVDSNLHLVFGDNNYNLVHFYQSDTGWFKDTISTSVMTNQVQFYPIIGKRAKALNCFYRALQTADTANQNFCYKRWTPAAGWDADSTIIVKDTRVKYSQTPPAMPDSLNWMPVWWNNYITHEIFYAKIDFDTLPPPTFTNVIELVSKNTTDIVMRTIYTGSVDIDSMVFWAHPQAGGNGHAVLAHGSTFTNPDTLTITGLTPGKAYTQCWIEIWDSGVEHESGAILVTMDVAPASTHSHFIGRIR